MASTQIAVRLPEKLIIELDGIVDDGEYGSRAEVVRLALDAFIDAERRRLIGEAIAEGYRRIPQTDDEFEGLEALAIRSIEDEPW